MCFSDHLTGFTVGSVGSILKTTGEGGNRSTMSGGFTGDLYSVNLSLLRKGSPTVSPTTNTTYYARNNVYTQYSAGCASFTVNVNSAPTVSSLVATGSVEGAIIKWYNAATGGTQYNGTEPLVNNQVYYASQTINGVESATRLAVTASVGTH